MRVQRVAAHPRRWRAGRRLSGAALAMATTALLAGCGCAPAPAGRSQPQGMRLNGADTTFLRLMSAELSQTHELLRLADGKVSDAELATLVAAIDATQDDELDTIQAWLDAAGAASPDTAGPNGPAADDHRHPLAVGGSPDPRDVARLQSVTHGSPFDVTLADMLLAHQQASSELARAELNDGRDKAVTGLALRVARSREAQVSLLLRMLSRLLTPRSGG